jgi:putative intracellular protease/amidase
MRHYGDAVTSIAIPLFPRFTALDGIGPYEVLQRIPHFDVTFVGHERGIVRSDNGMLGIAIDATFDELTAPDVVVFPGGIGTRALMTDDEVLGWVRRAHDTTLFTTSVCTGSLVLAAAGLLDGLTATTHSLRSGPSRPRSASSNTCRCGSSPRPACRAASTWRCASSRSSSTARRRRPPS